jgi:transcriptional regulator with XRE-family HTH domain
MRSPKTSRRKGRPTSESQGAREAFDYVQQYRLERRLSANALAIRFGMTPSSVIRALSDRSAARWTPTLRKLYYNAKNDLQPQSIDPVLNELQSYRGPGDRVVKRMLADMRELIVTLTRSRES